jgi:hypothetical protein
LRLILLLQGNHGDAGDDCTHADKLTRMPWQAKPRAIFS